MDVLCVECMRKDLRAEVRWMALNIEVFVLVLSVVTGGLRVASC